MRDFFESRSVIVLCKCVIGVICVHTGFVHFGKQCA